MRKPYPELLLIAILLTLLSCEKNDTTPSYIFLSTWEEVNNFNRSKALVNFIMSGELASDFTPPDISHNDSITSLQGFPSLQIKVK